MSFFGWEFDTTRECSSRSKSSNRYTRKEIEEFAKGFGITLSQFGKKKNMDELCEEIKMRASWANKSIDEISRDVSKWNISQKQKVPRKPKSPRSKKVDKKGEKRQTHQCPSPNNGEHCIINNSPYYKNRKMPPYDANNCCDMYKYGNDGQLWYSRTSPSRNYKWYKVVDK